MTSTSLIMRIIGFVCLLIYPLGAFVLGLSLGSVLLVVSGAFGILGVVAFLVSSHFDARRIAALAALLAAKESRIEAMGDIQRAMGQRIEAQAALINKLRQSNGER